MTNIGQDRVLPELTFSHGGPSLLRCEAIPMLQREDSAISIFMVV
jgi:hypothetical protein